MEETRTKPLEGKMSSTPLLLFLLGKRRQERLATSGPAQVNELGAVNGNLGFKSKPEMRQDLLKRTGSSEYLPFGGLEQGGRGTTGGPDLSSLSAGSLGYGGRSGSLQALTGSHGDRHTGMGSGDSRLRIKLEAAETRLHQYENEVCVCAELLYIVTCTHMYSTVEPLYIGHYE